MPSLSASVMPVDASVLRRDELVALQDDARVGVLGAGRGRGVDGGCTEVAHGADFSVANVRLHWRLPQALVAELVDALG